MGPDLSQHATAEMVGKGPNRPFHSEQTKEKENGTETRRDEAERNGRNEMKHRVNRTPCFARNTAPSLSLSLLHSGAFCDRPSESILVLCRVCALLERFVVWCGVV
mmetsp:Transcript_63966/g.130249  ORF Transcript_63966/g.130249 Transcript_63966/m.130249 type:complete len:106 (-) Transcript_63966:25-342(-)